MNNKFAIVSMMKNESSALIEWVSYHISLGVDRVFILDNESTDNSSEVLRYLSEVCNVEYYVFRTASDVRPQLLAFNEYFNKLKNDYDYLAFLDADEFLYPSNSDDLKSVIDKLFYKDCISAVAVNWCNFGSSGLLFKESQPVVKRFKRRAGKEFLANHHYKTIFRTHAVTGFLNPHHVATDGDYIQTNFKSLKLFENRIGLSEEVVWDLLRINHYPIKSVQEFVQTKLNRKNASTVKDIDKKSYFHTYDRNDVHDEVRVDLLCCMLNKMHSFLFKLLKRYNLESLPVEFHESISSLSDYLVYHVDSLFPSSSSTLRGWVLNKLGIKCHLVILYFNEVEEVSLPLNQSRPDVLKAILNGIGDDSALLGFDYNLNYEEVDAIWVSDGVVRKQIFKNLKTQDNM